MDDREFDKGIKEKLGEYEAPGFDPAALASLHHQMAAISITPWYATYRTELLVGSTVLLSALLIIWSQWMFTNKSTAALEAEIFALKSQQENTQQLQRQLEQLRDVKPDTVRIIEYQDQSSTVYLSLLRKIDHLETALKTMVEDNNRQRELFLAQLSEKSAARDATENVFSKSYLPLPNRISPRNKDGISKRAVTDDFPINPDAPQKNLSAKTIKDIQKHYQRGIGLRIGPVMSVSRGSFDPGNSRINVGGGVLADFIVSPSLSIETGITHSQRHNRIPSSDILQVNDFPGADPSLGELKNVDIDSWVFETPINLRYRLPVSLTSNWIVGAGYTPMFYTKQILEYDYQFGSNQSASINSSVIDKTFTSYPGTLNLSLGFSSELKNKKTLEASIFYRYGLGKVGIEQSIPEFIGIRGAYWFTVK